MLTRAPLLTEGRLLPQIDIETNPVEVRRAMAAGKNVSLALMFAVDVQ